MQARMDGVSGAGSRSAMVGGPAGCLGGRAAPRLAGAGAVRTARLLALGAVFAVGVAGAVGCSCDGTTVKPAQQDASCNETFCNPEQFPEDASADAIFGNIDTATGVETSVTASPVTAGLPITVVCQLLDEAGNPRFIGSDVVVSVIVVQETSVARQTSTTFLAQKAGSVTFACVAESGSTRIEDATPAEVTIVPGPPKRTEVTLDKTTVTAGEPIAASCTVYDEFYNAIADATPTVSVSPSAAAMVAATVAGGQVTISQAGAYEVFCDLPGATAEGKTVTVTAALAASIAASVDPPGTSYCRGQPIGIHWIVSDALGNPLSNSAVTVEIVPGASPALTPIGSSTSTFEVGGVGTYTVTVSVTSETVGGAPVSTEVQFDGTGEDCVIGPGCVCGDATCCETATHEPIETPITCLADCPVGASCGDGICDGAQWETTTTCPQDCHGVVCGDGTCGPTEIWQTCPADCPPPYVCGDGTCGSGEGCARCQVDCGLCSGCGDGTCSPAEKPETCPQDCGLCTAPSCHDGVCGPGETCSTNPVDCGVCPGCGDGACDREHGEWEGSCPVDCGQPEPCGDGTCSPTDGESSLSCPADCGALPSCGDDVCDGNLGEYCDTCPADCKDCPNCGNDACTSSAGETCRTCEDDCGACDLCGDGSCGSAESCSACTHDCGFCAGCGNGTCEAPETGANCPQDCDFDPDCGDTYCDPAAGEWPLTCPQDCGFQEGCGDGTCGVGEWWGACPIDCPAPPTCGDEDCDDPGEWEVSCPEDCGSPPDCGDGICDGTRGEFCGNCESDCVNCPDCGDDVCDRNGAGENCLSCEEDCATCEICGDGTCGADAGETCTVCEADCNECPVPPGYILDDGDVLTVLPDSVAPDGTISGDYEYCGRVIDPETIEELTVEGVAVDIAEDGWYCAPITPEWGMNFLEVVAEFKDTVGGGSRQFLISYIASGLWDDPEIERLPNTVASRMGQAFIDDGVANEWDSLNDFVAAIIESDGLAQIVGEQIATMGDLPPETCIGIRGVFTGACYGALIHGVFESIQFQSTPTVTMELADGGATAHIEFPAVRLVSRLNGADMYLAFLFNNVTMDLNLAITRQNGRPSVQVISVSPPHIGYVDIDPIMPNVILEIIAEIVALVAEILDQGGLRAGVAHVMGTSVSAALGAFFDQMFGNIRPQMPEGTVSTEPIVSGGTGAQLYCEVSYDAVEASSDRLLLGLGTKIVSVAPAHSRDPRKVAVPRGVRPYDLGGAPDGVVMAAHLSMLDQTSHALWRSGYFDFSAPLADVYIVGPEEGSMSLLPGLPIVLHLRDNGQIEIGMGAFSMSLDTSDGPIEIKVGAILTALAQLESGTSDRLELGSLAVEEIHIAPILPTTLTSEQLTNLDVGLRPFLAWVVGTGLSDGLVSFPWPTFEIPATAGTLDLAALGLPVGTHIGIIAPVLQSDWTVQHVVESGAMGLIDEEPVAGCTGQTGCAGCVVVYPCGWCATTSTCSEGDSEGPSSGACGSWAWGIQACS